MKVTTSQFKRCDVLHVEGRVDSSTASQLSIAFDALIQSGRFPYYPGSCRCFVYVQCRTAGDDQRTKILQTI